MKIQKSFFNTSDIEKILNLGRNTLRHYEQLGLLFNIKRDQSGYRQYTKQHLETLKFIIEAKSNGLTLKEIKTFTQKSANQEKIVCGSVAETINKKVSEIDAQIILLRNKKKFLLTFYESCSANNSDNSCNIIDSGLNKKACCPS
jgi:DNA-binding transcriptional MerR regulator